MDSLCRAGRKARTIVAHLKIEPFVFLFVISVSLSEITTTQLIQDKICLNKYNKSDEYCIGISKLKPSGDDSNGDIDNTKNEILADLAQFGIYTTLISSLPSFFYVLFIGSWTDNYIHGRKITLLVGSLGYAGVYACLLMNSIKFDLDVHYIILSYIPCALTGGWSCVWLTCYSYMSNNSSQEYRFIKFMAFEIAANAAGPLGTYLGGALLGRGNLHPTDGQIHNYERVFITSLIASITSFIWILLVINENKSENDENSNLINTIDSEIEHRDLNHNKDYQTHDKHEDQHIVLEIGYRPKDKEFMFSKMFDINHIKNVFTTCLKLRPNKGRAQIWLLYLSMCLYILSNVKEFQILFPYVEEVFEWNAQEFSQIKSMASISQIISMALIVLLLSGVFKVTDTKLGIIGFLSVLFAALSIGSLIHPIGLYLMYAIGSPSAISSMAIRSLLSKIANESEMGKVFSLLAALETVVPPLNVLFYNTLFEFTINFYPSLPFQIAGAIMFIPIFIFIWIDLTRIQFY